MWGDGRLKFLLRRSVFFVRRSDWLLCCRNFLSVLRIIFSVVRISCPLRRSLIILQWPCQKQTWNRKVLIIREYYRKRYFPTLCGSVEKCGTSVDLFHTIVCNVVSNATQSSLSFINKFNSSNRKIQASPNDRFGLKKLAFSLHFALFVTNRQVGEATKLPQNA